MKLLLLALVLSVGKVATECPVQCLCKGRDIDCSYRSLTQIPTEGISPHATSWDLSHNNLTFLHHDAFHIGRRFTNRIAVDLSFNQIANVSGNVFSHMENVMIINLTDNNITHIEFKHVRSDKLYALYLSHNPHLHLPEHGFELHHLKVLEMKSCGLSHIPNHFFMHMRRIEVLDLGRNKLSVLNTVTSHLHHLIHLDLSGNRFVTLPSNVLRHLDLSVQVKLGNNPFVCDCKTRPAYTEYAAHRGHVPIHCSYFDARSDAQRVIHYQFSQFYEKHCDHHDSSVPPSQRSVQVESRLTTDDDASSLSDHYGAVVAGALSAILAVVLVVVFTLKARRNVRLRDASPQRFSILKSSEEV